MSSTKDTRKQGCSNRKKPRMSPGRALAETLCVLSQPCPLPAAWWPCAGVTQLWESSFLFSLSAEDTCPGSELLPKSAGVTATGQSFPWAPCKGDKPGAWIYIGMRGDMREPQRPCWDIQGESRRDGKPSFHLPSVLYCMNSVQVLYASSPCKGPGLKLKEGRFKLNIRRKFLLGGW